MSLVILGMHRSGTSLLVGLLELHGYHLGDVSNQKSKLKPTGTKENLAVRKLNNQLFSACESNWKNPKLPDNLSLVLDNKINQAAAYFNSFSPWAIKDPRMVFTYNLWEKHLPQHQLIGTYRNPLEVANSLKVKNNISISEGLEIWRRYNTQLIKIWNHNSFPLIEFSADKQRYMSQFELITQHLGLDFKKQQSSDFFQHPGKILNKTGDLPAVYAELAEQLEQISHNY